MLNIPQHDEILTLLIGASAQKPSGFNVLRMFVNCSADQLNVVLDEMYAARKINQAITTKNGITQREVWPTGVVAPAERQNGRRLPPISPLRRAEKKLKTEKKPMQVSTEKVAEKPRALQVLEFIEANPAITTAEINQELKFISPVSYIGNHAKTGKVIKHSLTKRAATFTLAAGYTAASIYGKGVKGNGVNLRDLEKPTIKRQACRPEDKAMLATDAGKELVTKAAVALEQEEYDIPAFLRKSMQPEKPKANFESVNAEVKTKLKIAYTNQKTIMLFGLTESPIELSKEDSDELIDFCAQMDFCNSEEFALS